MEEFCLLGFGLDAWITIVTVLGMFSILLFTKLRSDLVFLAAIGILYVTGVLDAKEAFSGFSSTSVVVIGVLFVVVAGLTHTFQRLHARRPTDESLHSCSQHSDCQSGISVDAAIVSDDAYSDYSYRGRLSEIRRFAHSKTPYCYH